MIRRIEKALPIATRPPASVMAREVQVQWTAGGIIEAFPRTGRVEAREISADPAGARQISADPAGDSLGTGVQERDPGRGRVADPTPRQPCRVSSLVSPAGEPGTESVVVTLP